MPLALYPQTPELAPKQCLRQGGLLMSHPTCYCSGMNEKMTHETRLRKDNTDFNNVRFRLALLELPRVGRKTAARIAASITDGFPNSAHELYDLCQRSATSGIRIPQVDIRTVENAFDRAEQILEKSDKLNIQVYPYGDDRFPAHFWDMKEDSPQVMFVKGHVESLKSNTNAAVIGTRNPTPWGLEAGKRLVQVLSESEITIVSGLALGCDTVAHEGCLEAGGLTVAVLAHGLDMVQPLKNKNLAERIIHSGGCLISEYEVGKIIRPNQFIERNRLQAALSKALIVIETSTKGGTMHAVRHGQKLHRLLACINHPYDLLKSPTTEGNQDLIKTAQAFPLGNPKEVKNFIQQMKISDSSS